MRRFTLEQTLFPLLALHLSLVPLLPDKMTYLGQKMCVVVYPAESGGGSNGGGDEGVEMKEARSPLSKEDGDNHKAEDC